MIGGRLILFHQPSLCRVCSRVIPLATALARSPDALPRVHEGLTYQAHHPGLVALGTREINNFTTTTTITNNTILSEAERLVKAAQAEARIRNHRLLSHPRRNVYQPQHSSTNGPKIQSNGTVLSPHSDGTGNNGTVAMAAVVVTEALTKKNQTLSSVQKRAGSYWMENMVQNDISPHAGSGYKVWRNVKDYGAKGDGVTDDTAAINKAMSDGNRCGPSCGSSTTLQAVVYFPAGTYLVSGSLVNYYFKQMIGDATNPPTIRVSPGFVGLGVISSDSYIEGGNGASWYINQNNFYRQVRNFIVDMTNGPPNDAIAGIHWQVAQATSLQNIKFVMSTAAGNNQQRIYMENGSGGFMSDLEFAGGSLGAYVGNQQFTVRNLKFSNHQTAAIDIHWDWGWTWKGIIIEECTVGVIMRADGGDTLGSAIFIDSSFTNVPVGLELQAPSASLNATLNLFSVNITNVPAVVKYNGGDVLLAGSGSQTIAAWGLGKRYDSNDGEDSGTWQAGANYERAPEISSSLLKDKGSPTSGFFERSKPQYETVPANQFINVTRGGAHDWWDGKGQQFCKDFYGQTLDAMPGAKGLDGWRAFSYNRGGSGYSWVYVRVDALPDCKFVIELDDCKRIMSTIASQCTIWGGHMDGNCAKWMLDHGSHLFEGSAPPGNRKQNK